MIKRAATAILVACALVVCMAGCSDDESAPRELVLGATDSPAMQVMVRVYAGALRHTGTQVSSEIHTADYRTLLDDMDTTSVDLFPAFSGRLLAQLAPQLTPATADDVFIDLNRSLPQGVSVGDATMVTGTPRLFVASTVADEGEVTDLSDCDRIAAGTPVVVVGAPDQGVIEAFAAAGCRFGAVESVESVPVVVDRVAGGGAVGILTPLDVAGDDAEGAVGDIRALRADQPEQPAATGTTPTSREVRVAAVGPRPEQLVPVYRSAAFTLDEVKTINTVAGEMTTADLATLARRAVAGENPDDLANGWLAEHDL
ncbi:glycine/betaine ABC transporter substrate-binding protein [Gordonia sp. PKS22-38]|uniref:Glycine/betaine ABC transporter substrate-binding protein n=1 Tax=Gordonia prachuapensis TaxID=3115651 RepID=A0ABU7MRS7_9ACTN|nr:glycine/betaine ABC transporter substrate-binding protein [Gordonia sp. PKS22-38]